MSDPLSTVREALAEARGLLSEAYQQVTSGEWETEAAAAVDEILAGADATLEAATLSPTGYTAEDMKKYGEAVREACAKAVDETEVAIAKWGDETFDDGHRSLGDAARNVRSMPLPTPTKPVTPVDGLAAPCAWEHHSTNPPAILDDDGVLCTVSGKPGRLRHAVGDHFFDCPVAAPVPPEVLKAEFNRGAREGEGHRLLRLGGALRHGG